jgi:hypothetical protein
MSVSDSDTPFYDDYQLELGGDTSRPIEPPLEITTDSSSVTSQGLATAASNSTRRSRVKSRSAVENGSSRPQARGTRLRNRTAEFVAASARRISYDEMSCSGGSNMSMQSMQSTDTTSSIITALLGSARIAEMPTSSSDEMTEIMVVSDLRLAGLVRVLNSRERRDGIPKEYMKGNTLARRVKELFTFPLDKAPNWFWRPLFEGLVNGGANLNTMVAPPTGAQPMPIITWLCQWQSMQKIFYWKGNADVLSLALAAGANPNAEMSNGSTPIFFAVKYGCVDTVKLLIKYGADITVKDKKGRSCLWNALERPIPEVITYLLKEGGLSADEAFPYRRKQGRRKTGYQTAIDYLFAAQLSLSFDEANNPEYPWSWQVLGVPTEESIALAMIEFGKRGATFSANDITLELISFVLRGDDPNRRRNRYPKYEEAKVRLQHLAHLMVGRWLPEQVKQEMMKQEQTKMPEREDLDVSAEPALLCNICQEDINETGRPNTKLYCGHNYCLGCILSHCHDDGTSILDLTCPMCKHTLCLEVTGSVSRRWECLTELYGDWDSGCHGPRALTTQQLRAECQARGITTMLRNDQKLKQLLFNDAVGSSKKEDKEDKKEGFDLNTNIPIADLASENPTAILLAPKGGPVAIPIVVKGIPVTAYISTTSYYTLVAPEFVELFGLDQDGQEKTEEDGHCLGVSTQFKNLLGRPTVPKEDGTAAPLRRLKSDFQFRLGGTTYISLPSALVAPLPSCMGVQLGMDFLRSGAWCVIDAKLEGEMEQLERSGSFVSTDGFGHVSYITGRTRRTEELRYYARDGTILRTPLLHLQPFQRGCMMTNWVSVAYDDSLAECNWCCRVFYPEGMLLLQEEEGECYYCTESCREASRDVRKARQEFIL